MGRVLKPGHKVADILNKHHHQLDKLVGNSWKERTLHAVRQCRTAALGGHIDKCSNPRCRKLHLSYNSCRNRHCPTCQGHLKEQWIQAREQELLPVPYFHVVFTLPGHLNELALQDPSGLYAALFKIAWQVMKGFADNHKFLGAKTGMVAILHTWGQNLSLHPHLHCIVPGGGLTSQDKWKPCKNKGKYLFPVKEMSKVFRARFVEALRQEYDLPDSLYKKLFAKPWVVYAKQPFKGPAQVVGYLGRYTHKIAISNHRIKALHEGKVAFQVKDYRRGGKKTLCTLSEQEFIRRFSQHILPKGFVRIRHYGLLSSSTKVKNLELVREQIGKVPLKEKQKLLHLVCRACGKGKLETLVVFGQRGPPPFWQKQLKSQ